MAMKNVMMGTKFNMMDVIIVNFNVLLIVQIVLRVNVHNVLLKKRQPVFQCHHKIVYNNANLDRLLKVLNA